MNYIDIKMAIRHYITTHFPLAGRQTSVADSESLFASGIVDSLGVLDLVTFIEDAFGVIVADEDLLADNFETIDQVAAFVQAKQRHPVLVS